MRLLADVGASSVRYMIWFVGKEKAAVVSQATVVAEAAAAARVIVAVAAFSAVASQFLAVAQIVVEAAAPAPLFSVLPVCQADVEIAAGVAIAFDEMVM